MAKQPQKRSGGAAGVLVPFVAAMGIVGLGVAWFAQEQQAPRVVAAPEGCITTGLDAIGGPIDLIDINGRQVTQAELAGAPSFVYFGFTHCPDVCPTTMLQMADAINTLGPSGAGVQPVLITLDPERDTTDVMDAFIETSGFPTGLVGLTGTPAQANAAAAAFKVSHRRTPTAGSSDYTVDHSSFVYLMDGDWRTRGLYNTIDGNPSGLAQCARAALGPDLGADSAER